LNRAATFAFGAGVVGATALVGCEDEVSVVPVYGAPAAGAWNGGPVPGEGGQGTDSPAGGESGQGAAPSEGGQSGAPPVDSGGTGGVAFAVYGGPPGGEGAQ
jgi:hypothetical protein